MAQKTEMVVIRLDKSEKRKLEALANGFQRSHSGTLRYLINGAAAQLEIELAVSNDVPNNNHINTVRGDILRHVREIEKLLQVDEKMIDWSRVVEDIKANL